MAVRFSHFVPVEQTPVNQFQAQALRQPRQKPVVLPGVSLDQFTASHTNSLKFGSREQDDDVTFKKLFGLGKQLAKKTYQKAKTKAKEELAKPNSEKKVALAAGVVGFVAAEVATFGTTGGIAGATAASAAGGYVGAKLLKKHQQQQVPANPVPDDASDSDDDEHRHAH